MKDIRFHSGVQRDINSALRHYRKESERLADEFWVSISDAFELIRQYPERHHLNPSGYRRLNLKRFPYNMLFEELWDRVRVVVVRHNSRKPGFGTRRKWSESGSREILTPGPHTTGPYEGCKG